MGRAMSKISVRRHAVAALFVAFALAALPAAAQIQVKACFETVLKRCCEVATGVDLTITCSEGDQSWICVGKIDQNNLISTTQASVNGWKFSTNGGTDECKYTKPACGSFRGDCKYGDAAAATCQSKTATGAVCTSPVLAALDADGDGEIIASAVASCH